MLSESSLFTKEKEISIKITRFGLSAGWCVSIGFGAADSFAKTAVFFNSKEEGDDFLTALALVVSRGQALQGFDTQMQTVVELINTNKKENF